MTKTIEEILEDLKAQRELLQRDTSLNEYQAKVSQLLAHLERRDLPKIHKAEYCNEPDKYD